MSLKRMGRIAVLLIWISMSGVVYCQSPDCPGYDEASQDPAGVQCISIDCFRDDCNVFFATIEEYVNLNVLEVINCDRDYFPRDMRQFTQLQNISICQSPNLNYANLLRKFSALPSLTALTLDNCGLRTLPKTIILIQKLRELSVKNNENFNIESSIGMLSHLPQLKSLSLPVNQISGIPENISLLKNLEVLDISDNQLTDLPKNMGKMDSLHVLNVEKNIFINPVKTLEKLKGINIRYLSYDPIISGKDKEKLQKIFPRARIVEVFESSDLDDYEDEEQAEFAETVDADDSGNEFRKILVTGEKFQALSDAYLHYPEIFHRDNFKNTFDSLLFEERYADTSYANVWKIQPWREYNNVSLHLFRFGERGEIWFDFHRESKKGLHISQYVAKNNPEIMAFLGYKWVYQGTLTPQQFVRQFIKTSSGRRYWNDVRIYYNEQNKNFTIELKDRSGFTQITAHLRARSTITSLEKSQEIYTSFFERYSKSLDGRNRRFQRRMLKDLSAYKVTMQRSIAIAWEGFRRVYMSLEEKQMSRKEWLEYYDVILSDEKKSLVNAAPSATLLERSFYLEGYKKTSAGPVITDTSILKSCNAQFRDDKKNMVAAKVVITVDMTNRSYRIYEGSLGLKHLKLHFRADSKYAIISELRNGDIGVLSPAAFAHYPLRHNKDVIFTVERISYKISTIGQIKELMGM